MDDTEKRQPGKMPSNLEIALIYASRGWRVVPVWMAHDGVCACVKGAQCKDAGKHPRTRHGHDAGTTDEKRIRTWKWDTANIGIVTGPGSGLLVVDIDPRNGGDGTFARLVSELGELPSGPRVQTGGDGQHRYFQHPEVPIRKPADWQGIDIKSDGGMVVAPPSMHKSGKKYAWIEPGGTPLPELPETWLRALTDDSGDRDSESCYRDVRGPLKTSEDVGGRRMTPAPRSLAATELPLDQFVDICIQETLPEHPGKRHDAVFQLARYLRGDARMCDLELKDLRPIVDRWYERLAGRIGRDKIQANIDENWFDFAEGWGQIKYPGKGGLMTALWERARRNDPPEIAKQYGSEETRLLVTFCRELQRETGNEPFFLATTIVDRLFGLNGNRMRAWRWLDGLVRDGVLECVKKGDPARRIASRFRYRGD